MLALLFSCLFFVFLYFFSRLTARFLLNCFLLLSCLAWTTHLHFCGSFGSQLPRWAATQRRRNLGRKGSRRFGRVRLASNRRLSACERLFSKVAACEAVYHCRRFSKSKHRVGQVCFRRARLALLVYSSRWDSFAFADLVRARCRFAVAWLLSCLSGILLATCFLVEVRGVLFCMLRVRQMLCFSRLYLSSTVSVHDKYNLEKQRMANTRRWQCIAAKALCEGMCFVRRQRRRM